MGGAVTLVWSGVAVKQKFCLLSDTSTLYQSSRLMGCQSDGVCCLHTWSNWEAQLLEQCLPLFANKQL